MSSNGPWNTETKERKYSIATIGPGSVVNLIRTATDDVFEPNSPTMTSRRQSYLPCGTPRHSSSSVSEQRTATSVSPSQSSGVTDFVLPPNKLKSRSPDLTATSELLAYLDNRNVKDYHAAIKEEVEGTVVFSEPLPQAIDNFAEFGYFPSFQTNFDRRSLSSQKCSSD